MSNKQVDPSYIASLISEDPNVTVENTIYYPTVQVRNTVERLMRRHGYTATFSRAMGDGLFLYSIGGIWYRIRGDGTII